MSCLIIEELPSSPNCSIFSFYAHPHFLKDLKTYKRKNYPVDKSIEYLTNLLETHFNSKVQEKPLSNNIHLAEKTESLPIYKTIIAIPGLRSGQCPRVYLLIVATTMIFLCADDHSNNYKDSELRAEAIARAKESIDILHLEEYL
jgi:hypothetical protein